MGLQKYNSQNQINGFAILDKFKKDLIQIIKGSSVSSIVYNSDKKLFFSAINKSENGNQNYNVIKIFDFNEEKDGPSFNYIYQFVIGNQDSIVSLTEIKNKDKETSKNKKEENKI